MEKSKIFIDKIVQEFEWKVEEAKNIWCFGPNYEGPNVLVNAV